jgi:glycosyltransferase involved in cell wall biosynthesis
VRDYLLQHYPDIVPERIEVIHRGVSGADYPYGFRPDEGWQTAFFRQYPAAGGKQLLTLPGRITRLKGHEAFIEILAELVREGRPVHGLIVGGASHSKQRYLVELQQEVRAQGLASHLSFTGQRQDLKNIMAISRLVFSLSSQPESFGRTTLEALRLGIPVAGYNHGGVGEILRNVYPPGCLPLHDRDACLARIRSLLDAAPAVPTHEFFPLSAMLARTLEVYARLVPSLTPHPPPLSPQAGRGEQLPPSPLTPDPPPCKQGEGSSAQSPLLLGGGEDQGEGVRRHEGQGEGG